MKILILNRHPYGFEAVEPWNWMFSQKGYEVDYLSMLDDRNTLSNYDAVIAHPRKEDLELLYTEANKRKNFKLILFDVGSTDVDVSSQFKNNNVLFDDALPSPSELVNMLNS